MGNKIEGLMESAVSKIKDIVNADTIIGNAITAENGTVIIPVSKVTYGFAGGGSDIASNKSDKEMFGGGNGAGVSIIPVAFLVINGDDVKLLQIESFSGSLDRIIAMTPDIVDKIGNAIKKRKDKKQCEKDKSGKDKLEI